MKKTFAILIPITSLLLPIVALAQDGTSGFVRFPNPLGSGPDSIRSIPDLIETIANNIILPVGSVIVVIMVIYSGFLFVTAQGNDTKLSDAKKTFMYTVIGALILLGSWVIANVVKETVCLLYENPPTGLDCGGGSSTTTSTSGSYEGYGGDIDIRDNTNVGPADMRPF